LSRWLAINDDYHGELKFMEGQQAIEDLSGKWFMEIPEMSAFTKAKDQEAVKAFISRQRDQYRKPYDRNTTEIPRRCIFVASSNSYNMLVDKSGNRRWHPVEFKGDYKWGFHLYDIEAEVREYINQCWAEALHFRDDPYMKPFVNSSLSREITEAQDNAMQDDWRVGAIQSFLERKNPGEFTCVRELCHRALYPDQQKEPTFAESKDIGQILNRLDGWERVGVRKIGMYGNQRCWRKLGEETTPDKPFWEE
jgi:predicted P-loop ATPase